MHAQRPRSEIKKKQPATRSDRYVLRLYVAGLSARSSTAIRNLRRICDEHLQDRCELEVIDIYAHPTLARGEQIIAAPTLIKQLPLPLRRLIGDMADTDRVLVGLDLRRDSKPRSDGER
ncbi:MAG TPA: circadian clock KaiB family protein [Candidatus Krumholzibacteria bacterium]|nr:circadian clock KaiB family protein [Candidatus Krumholzibacteria bacterium]